MMRKLVVLLAGLFLIACSKSDLLETPDFSGKILSAEPVENGLYAYICPKTGTRSEILVAKNFNNAGDNLEIVKNSDGSYSTGNITIYPSKGQFLRLPVDVFAKSVSFVDMDLTEPDYLKTKAYEPGEYATFIAPFSCEAPSGVSVYLVTGIKSGNELELEEISGNIPANTACIIYTTSTKATLRNTDTVVYGTLSKTKASGVNMLVGTLMPSVINPVVNTKRYVLQNSGDKFKFLKVTSSITVPANKAYLEIPNNQ